MVRIRNKKKQIIILLFFIFTLVTFIFLGLDKKSYAFDYESNYMKDYMGKSKYDVLERLEGQGLTCK